MKEYFQYLEQLNSTDFTSNSDFDNSVNRWLDNKCMQGQIHKVSGEMIGTANKNGKPIILDELMSNHSLNLHDKCYGIYIPSKEILRRTKYEWFARMSFSQLLSCDVILCKHLLLSNKLN